MKGWILDLYPGAPGEMVVWLKREDGEAVRLVDRWSPSVFVHEFGHHFAGLADEYFTSETAYLPPTDRVEPWEPNVTALKDPAQLKWKALLSEGLSLRAGGR